MVTCSRLEGGGAEEGIGKFEDNYFIASHPHRGGDICSCWNVVVASPVIPGLNGPSRADVSLAYLNRRQKG